MSTPPIPQSTVSQSGMLSRSPGAKNLPSSPMMMPAMITPMMSTGDPFPCWGRPGSTAFASTRPAEGSIPDGNHGTTEGCGPFAEHLKGPHQPAGHGKADPAGSSWRLAAVTWRSRLASWEPASALVHLHRMRSVKPARGQDREGHEAIRPARTTARHHEGVGRALWRWRLRDPDQGPPERLAAGRLRGPDGHRQAGRDRPAWSGPGPVLAPRTAGPHPVAGPGTGRDSAAPRSSRRACRRVRAAAVTALDRLAVPGWDAPEAVGATARVGLPRGNSQSLKASLTSSPACFRSLLAWSVRPSASSSWSSVARPSLSLACPLTSWALFLALSSTPMGLASWSSGPLLLPWIRNTKLRQGNPGSSRRLALTHMAWDGWSVPPQRGAVGRRRQQDHGVVSGPQPGSGAPGGSQVGTGPGQLHRPGRGRAHRGAVGSGLSDGGLVRQPPGGAADSPGSPGRHRRVRHPRQGAAGRLGGGSDRPDR